MSSRIPSNQYNVTNFRSSVRSKDSSSTTNSGDPTMSRVKIKDCCRKLIAFMCTQVGVGGLIVCYTIIGAIGFRAMETEPLNNPYELQIIYVESAKNKCLDQLWNVTSNRNIFDEGAWKKDSNVYLKKYQDEIVSAIKKGYNGFKAEERWSFPAALMYCLSIISMIGYGNLVPLTDWGKGTTIIYAVFGIPLYVLYFLNMGEVLAQTFRWLYTWFYECSTEDYELDVDLQPTRLKKRIIVPTTACLWVLTAYIVTGTIMFATWESWDYLDSCYFCVTSLCKIGFGDFVPGANILDAKSGNQTKLIINFVYILLGMGLVAMCYNLMKEEVKVKLKETREDISHCMEDIRIRFVNCAQKCDSYLD